MRDTADLSIRFTHPRELAALASALREQARRDRPCAELYGGPHRAFVTGTLRGETVSARFTRVDSCAIAAYDALLKALDRPPAESSAGAVGRALMAALGAYGMPGGLELGDGLEPAERVGGRRRV